jgi:hypothetical protein
MRVQLQYKTTCTYGCTDAHDFQRQITTVKNIQHEIL